MPMNPKTMSERLFERLHAHYEESYYKMMAAQNIKDPTKYPKPDPDGDLMFLCKAISEAVVDEVRKASVTLDFERGSAGKRVDGILSTAPTFPVTGIGTFSPNPDAPASSVLS